MIVEALKFENTSGFELDIENRYSPEEKTLVIHVLKIHADSLVAENGGEVSNGKLTGIQLRAIAAKDQLDALLEDECFDCIKSIAESDISDIVECCSPDSLSPEKERMIKTIQAMALFCYTEIVERGLKKPGIE